MYTDPSQSTKQTITMARLPPREEALFHNPSITRAQLTPKTPTRDASFSTYLKPNDSEISIFDAEKYFNGVHEPNNKTNPKQPDIPTIGRLSLSTPKQSVSSISRLSSVSDDSYGRNYRTRSFHATPTASSEASWNSQTGLLTNPPNLAPVSIQNFPIKKSAASNWFRRGNICPCSGKKSVNVKGANSETETSKLPPTPPRIVQLNRISSSCGSNGYLYPNRQPNFISRPQLDQNKFKMKTTNPNLAGAGVGNGFTFPILNNKAAPPIVIADGGESAVETPRDSIEVFQPKEGGGGRNFTLPVSPKSRRASYDDDICSDASSDLFEIESFSTSATQSMFPRRDSLDDPESSFNVRRLQMLKAAAITGLADDEPVTPSIAPTECYAPSEVSVDWSVTTAEGFDRASLAGFSVSASELGFPAKRQLVKFGSGSGSDESKKKGSGGLLTSCRCEKAVSVAEIRPAIPASSTRGRAQAQIHVNGGGTSTSRSNLRPLPFATESLGHRHSL